MTNLYELTGQFLAVSKLADDPDMPETALEDTLEGITGEIDAKAQAILQVCTNMDADIEGFSNEIKRLTARKQVLVNRKERLREYLRTNMEITGIDKIECPLFVISLRKATPMVDVVEESLIPKKYIKTVTTTSPIKKAILDDLKAGKDIPGCRIGYSIRSLQVK